MAEQKHTPGPMAELIADYRHLAFPEDCQPVARERIRRMNKAVAAHNALLAACEDSVMVMCRTSFGVRQDSRELNESIDRARAALKLARSK